jgi:hypothetical protein
MSPLFALGASLSYGVADYVGALAARRTSALTVTFGMQTVGLLVLLPLLPFLPGTCVDRRDRDRRVSGAAGTGASSSTCGPWRPDRSVSSARSLR